MQDTKQTSKLISYWLRHDPGEGNLIIDDFGWVSIADLIKAIALKGQVYTKTEIEELSRSFDKVRWEFSKDGTQIRATHGHSIPVILDEKSLTPPAILYHGTSSNKIEDIFKHGLLTMSRQFVHLSLDKNIALSVGKRHGKPFLIEIDATSLAADGWLFYQTSDNVWLTNSIPVKYLSFEPWQMVTDEEKVSLLDQLIKETQRGHPLFGRGLNLSLLMRRYDCDDTLFMDTENSEVYVVHLTWNNNNAPDFPSTKKYKSFDDWIKTELRNDQMDWY